MHVPLPGPLWRRRSAGWSHRGYALYAVAVALTVLQFDDKIDRIITWYGRAVPIFLVVSPTLFFIAQYAPSVIPHWPWGPGGGVLLVDQRLGHTGMHYAGIFSFIVMGLAPTAVSYGGLLFGSPELLRP